MTTNATTEEISGGATEEISTPAAQNTSTANETSGDTAAGQNTSTANETSGDTAADEASKDPKTTGLLRDLAESRQKYQAVKGQLGAVLEALGVKTGEDVQTPEQIADAARAGEREARAELAVFRGAPAGVDAAALLDSRSFLAAIADVDPSDQKAVSAAIMSFVEDKPQFRAVGRGQGVGDATATGDPGVRAESMDDKIRARIFGTG